MCSDPLYVAAARPLQSLTTRLSSRAGKAKNRSRRCTCYKRRRSEACDRKLAPTAEFWIGCPLGNKAVSYFEQCKASMQTEWAMSIRNRCVSGGYTASRSTRSTHSAGPQLQLLMTELAPGQLGCSEPWLRRQPTCCHGCLTSWAVRSAKWSISVFETTDRSLRI